VIWCHTFEDRLRAWHDLRQQISRTELDAALLMTNDWWWQAPMVTRSIDLDVDLWPGPWELLAEAAFSDVARALAMSYTVLMAHRSDIQELDIIAVAGDNLVRVNGGKYIVNWRPGSIVNNPSPESAVSRIICGPELQRLIG